MVLFIFLPSHAGRKVSQVKFWFHRANGEKNCPSPPFHFRGPIRLLGGKFLQKSAKHTSDVGEVTSLPLAIECRPSLSFQKKWTIRCDILSPRSRARTVIVFRQRSPPSRKNVNKQRVSRYKVRSVFGSVKLLPSTDQNKIQHYETLSSPLLARARPEPAKEIFVNSNPQPDKNQSYK